MATEIYTNVVIDGKTYSIKRFDAKTGLKLARFLIAKAAPIIPLLDPAENAAAKKARSAAKNESVTPPDDLYEIVGKVFDTLSDEDVDMLVDKCLRVCYLNLPGGPQAVIDEMGHYGVEDVEYDIPLTVRLCFEAIKWGASDFFGENSSLSSLLKKYAG